MRLLAAIVVVAAGASCKSAEANVKDREPSAPGGKPPAATIKLTSPAFGAGAEIPTEFTCEGANRSPPLAWDSVPAAAKSLVLVVDDPDAPDPAAPKRIWVHWVVGGLPIAARGLATGASTSLPAGAASGKNDWGNADYGGPCPPIGRHRYFFKLYALDRTVDVAGLDKAGAVKAIDGHVLAKGELMGTYQKKK